MRLARTAARMIARNGETMTLKRAGQTDITVKAKRYSLSPDGIAGSMDDAQLAIKIAHTEIAASAAPTRYPRKGDIIAPAAGGAFVVVSCDTRFDGETPAVHVLAVAGQ